VDAFAGQGIQIDRQGGRQGLALTRTHFRDLAIVQDHPSDELNVEMAHAENPFTGLADDGKRFREQIF
jgi:hypothetical protein